MEYGWNMDMDGIWIWMEYGDHPFHSKVIFSEQSKTAMSGKHV